MPPEKASQIFYGLQETPWNHDFKRIKNIKSRLSWINERYSDGGVVASDLIENFTVRVDYDYILELDECDNIIGGEWLYESNNNHPDFLWVVQGKTPSDTVSSVGLSYPEAVMLLEKSVECCGSTLVVEFNTNKTTLMSSIVVLPMETVIQTKQK
ncbi:hypothetical protein L917_20736 [Phytophthora nicotianae]|uniref:Uncharacterized protein n=2 Tax=Phytophthora nicotianae TaxID=4792 RepID=W2FP16_PHYNI|nr:hypothetical protein L915_21005 [Phytophthora nicotianae]ETL78464.1 hypothetical protein L917_20736 [Phytophthora nicotianae]ETO60138.1 hypothetical protein F444_21629 [Phytophthora nicotianae P1976]